MTAARYDYIVVGGGSSGAVVAARLTENPDLKVLLLEAGRASHPYARIPISFGLFFENPSVNWRYFSAPEENLSNRRIYTPRGKILGGTSAINGMVYVRGQEQDYDTWAQFGNRGWSWHDIEPIFRRMESFSETNDRIRGHNGPLFISTQKDNNPLYGNLFDAAQSVGIRKAADYNGSSQDGIARTQSTARGGYRMSTAECYINPARKRGNLHIVTQAMVGQVVLEGTRCVGVSYRQHGQLHEARADREVVLSAGVIGTPQILELSGIGNPEILSAHGLQIKQALPGVGEHLRDHLYTRMQWKLQDPKLSYNSKSRGAGLAAEIIKYAAYRGGFLSYPAAPVVAFVKSRVGLACPDIQVFFSAFGIQSGDSRKLHTFPSMSAGSYQMRPESLGSVHISSPRSEDHPVIKYNYLADPMDRRVTLDGVLTMRRIMDALPMQQVRGDEIMPGKNCDTEDELMAWIRESAISGFHPVGTCRMGSGPECVVDDKLRVYGIANLRIADASIMPTMPSGNTNGPAIMVGEKAFDLLRARD